MNALDKAIGYFAPEWAYRRARFRAAAGLAKLLDCASPLALFRVSRIDAIRRSGGEAAMALMGAGTGVLFPFVDSTMRATTMNPVTAPPGMRIFKLGVRFPLSRKVSIEAMISDSGTFLVMALCSLIIATGAPLWSSTVVMSCCSSAAKSCSSSAGGLSSIATKRSGVLFTIFFAFHRPYNSPLIIGPSVFARRANPEVPRSK